MTEASLRRFNAAAGPLLELLAEVRLCQTYCLVAEAAKRQAPWRASPLLLPDDGPPALAAFERELLARLQDLRAQLQIVVH